jgi:hypothetical protein
MSKFINYTAEKGQFSETIQPVLAPKLYKLACCDCGLVHDIRFSIYDAETRQHLVNDGRLFVHFRSASIRSPASHRLQMHDVETAAVFEKAERPLIVQWIAEHGGVGAIHREWLNRIFNGERT